MLAMWKMDILYSNKKFKKTISRPYWLMFVFLKMMKALFIGTFDVAMYDLITCYRIHVRLFPHIFSPSPLTAHMIALFDLSYV